MYWWLGTTSLSGWRYKPSLIKRQLPLPRSWGMRYFANSPHQNSYTQIREDNSSPNWWRKSAKYSTSGKQEPPCTTHNAMDSWNGFNRTLLDMLAMTAKRHLFNWEDQLRKVCMVCNTSVHAPIGFYLMFGWQAKLPISLVNGTGDSKNLSVIEYASNWRKVWRVPTP